MTKQLCGVILHILLKPWVPKLGFVNPLGIHECVLGGVNHNPIKKIRWFLSAHFGLFSLIAPQVQSDSDMHL